MSRIATPHGAAELTEHVPVTGSGGTALVLHGAGTSSATPLLVGLCDALAQAGVRALRLDQPYTLGPRRPPAPAAQLDAVVSAVLADIDGPVVLLGRSSGARVACRVSATAASDLRGVLALAFPLSPPGRPHISRAGELAAATVPVCIIQGTRDPFGSAKELSALALNGVSVHEVAGADHGFGVRRRDGRDEADVFAEVVGVVVPVVLDWLAC